MESTYTHLPFDILALTTLVSTIFCFHVRGHLTGDLVMKLSEKKGGTSYTTIISIIFPCERSDAGEYGFCTYGRIGQSEEG